MLFGFLPFSALFSRLLSQLYLGRLAFLFNLKSIKPEASGLCSLGRICRSLGVDRFIQKEIPELTSLETPFHTTGSLRVGFTALEEQWFKNLESRSKNLPFEFEFVSSQPLTPPSS